MRILLLAPHPFYQERGTPIAVSLILQVISKRGDEVKVLTFHEGQTPVYPGVTIKRISPWSFARGIRPGFSLKKLVCDAFLFVKVLQCVFRKHYDVVHAVEESVFMALMVKWLVRIPYIYDMDSSLAQQMMEKYAWLSKISFLLNACEGMVIRHARAVLPVCEALSKIVQTYNQHNVMVLHDVPLSKDQGPPRCFSLKPELGLEGSVVMYVGNLEHYQGIDLLLKSFALVRNLDPHVDLVIIGGEEHDIVKYTKMAEGLEIHRCVHFQGPKPVEALASYLAEADILVSPRISGNNTPMKVYSYLQSGVPVVATNLLTHTQVMDERVAELVNPTPEGFSAGLLRLLNSDRLRGQLGMAAQELIKAQFSYDAFSQKVNHLYDWVKTGGETSLASAGVFSPSPNPQV